MIFISLPRALQGVVGILACSVALHAYAGNTQPCEALSPEQVSAIVGSSMRLTSASQPNRDETGQHCIFSSENRRVELTVHRAANEHAAAKRYERELQRVDGATGEPLHGVGTESRLRITEKGSTIVARFGVHVVMVSTNAGREAVVGLARAAGAKVTRQ